MVRVVFLVVVAVRASMVAVRSIYAGKAMESRGVFGGWLFGGWLFGGWWKNVGKKIVSIIVQEPGLQVGNKRVMTGWVIRG